MMVYNLPSKNQALSMLRKKNPSNIVNHSIKVSELSMKIGIQLKNKGIPVDLKLLEIAALLHDLDKYESLSKGFDYKKNVLSLRKKGFQKLANTIFNEQLDAFLSTPFQKHPIEEIVVQYADKRVLHTRVVSLNKRFAYLYKRYGSDSAKILKKLKQMKKVLGRIEAFLKRKGVKVNSF